MPMRLLMLIQSFAAKANASSTGSARGLVRIIAIAKAHANAHAVRTSDGLVGNPNQAQKFNFKRNIA